jgi:hypothetical protein
MLIIVLIAAGVGIAIVSSMSDSQRIRIRSTVYDSVTQSVDSMKSLIDDNAKSG